MTWSAFTASKYKSGQKLGDDVCLMIPHVMAAVFDGASRPQISPRTGVSAGRAASLSASLALASMQLEDTSSISAEEIFSRLNAEMRKQAKTLEFDVPIQTTAAIVFEYTDEIRVLVIGDTSVRINADKVLSQPLEVDAISIAARLAIWNCIKSHLGDAGLTELRARQTFVGGVNKAIRDGIIQEDWGRQISSDLEGKVPKKYVPYLDEFLRQGIEAQTQLINTTQHLLGYPILDGNELRGPILEEIIPKSEVTSIEIFSDGYTKLPEGISLRDWEAAFQAENRTDPFRLHEYKGVKGTTDDEWCDDRTVISIDLKFPGFSHQ